MPSAKVSQSNTFAMPRRAKGADVKQCGHTFEVTREKCAPCNGLHSECAEYEPGKIDRESVEEIAAAKLAAKEVFLGSRPKSRKRYGGLKDAAGADRPPK
jgi:hypothetical protein